MISEMNRNKITKIAETVKGLLIDPSNTFSSIKNESFDEAQKYYINLAAIYSAISALMYAIENDTFYYIIGFFSYLIGLSGPIGKMAGILTGIALGIVALILIILFYLFLAIVTLFLTGAIIHIFVLILGGKKGFRETKKTLMFCLTPALLLGLIPVVNIIGVIWSLALAIPGLQRFHELTKARATLAVVMPAIVTVAIIAILYYMPPTVY